MPINASSGALSYVRFGRTNAYSDYWASYNSGLSAIQNPFVDSDNYLYCASVATGLDKIFRTYAGPVSIAWNNNFNSVTHVPAVVPVGFSMIVDDVRNKIYAGGYKPYTGTFGTGSQGVLFIGNTSDGSTRKYWNMPPYDTLASTPYRKIGRAHV